MKFLHIQSDFIGKHRWRVGEKYEIGSENNPYYSRLFSEPDDENSESFGGRSVNEVCGSAWMLAAKNIKAKSFDESHYGHLCNHLGIAVIALENEMKKVRELVFEEVRRLKFSDRPSRRSCVWFLENERESINTWCMNMNFTQASVYEVELDGVHHRTRNSLLKVGARNLSELFHSAFRYWSSEAGSGASAGEVEILASGKIEILSLVAIIGKNKVIQWM